MIIRQISFTKFIQYSSTRLSLSTYIYISKRFMFRLKHLGTKLLTPIRPTIIRTHFGPFNLVYPDIIIPNILQGDGISIFAPPKPLLLTSDKTYYDKKEILNIAYNINFNKLLLFNKIAELRNKNEVTCAGLLKVSPSFFKELLASTQEAHEARVFLFAAIISPPIFYAFKNESKTILELLENVISHLFLTLPKNVLESLNYYQNKLIVKYWSGNKLNSYQQHMGVSLLGLEQYPKELLENAFFSLFPHLKILYSSFGDKVPIHLFIEKYIFQLNLHDLPRLLPPNTTITFFAINDSNASKIPLFTCEISYDQIKQNYADFAIIVKVTDPNDPTVAPLEFIICKDVKAASTDGGTSGRLSILPNLNTDVILTKQYLNGIIGVIGHQIHLHKLNKQSFMGKLYKELSLYQKTMDVKNIETNVKEFFTLLKKHYTDPEILKYMNISLSVDPGKDNDYSVKDLPRIMDNIKKNADPLICQKFLESLFNKSGKLNKNKVREAVEEFIEKIEPDEEIKNKLLDNFHKYLKNLSDNDDNDVKP